MKAVPAGTHIRIAQEHIEIQIHATFSKAKELIYIWKDDEAF